MLLALLSLSFRSAGQTPAAKPPAWPATAPVGEWQLPAKDYALTRFSPLTAINAATVRNLRPIWSFATGSLRNHGGNPLVVGQTLYVHTPYPNVVFALDLARPGAPIIWKYAPTPPKDAMPTSCCDGTSWGLAYHPGGKLYVPLLQGDLAAIDAKTGHEIWRVKTADYKTGATTPPAPLVIRDMVLMGMAGGDHGVRGYLTALNALTGQLLWRAYSTGPDADVLLTGTANPHYPSHQGKDLGVSSWAGEAWRNGGGAPDGWISYDPDLDLLYYGTGNAAPGNATLRPGDNKWSSTIFARDVTTGKVRWAYQVTPHDEWAYGGSNESILADLTVDGKSVKALVHFDPNGFAYTIDRTNGKLLLAERFGPVNWASTIDLGTGLPVRDGRYSVGTERKTLGVCPSSLGIKGQQPAAFSPLSGLFYVSITNVCMDIQGTPVTYIPGKPYIGTKIAFTAGPGGNRGRFIAWDATNGTIAWESKESLGILGGPLATAGGVVFYGTMDGWLKAVDHKTGEELWKFKMPSGIAGSPITFSDRDGHQYLAILSGLGQWPGVGGTPAFTDLGNYTNPGGVLMVFGM